MRTVHKFPLHLDREVTEIGVNPEAKVVLCALDPQGFPCLWFEITKPDSAEEFAEARLERRQFRMVMTGDPILGSADSHVGSLVDGRLVRHVYELGV